MFTYLIGYELTMSNLYHNWLLSVLVFFTKSLAIMIKIDTIDTYGPTIAEIHENIIHGSRKYFMLHGMTRMPLR